MPRGITRSIADTPKVSLLFGAPKVGKSEFALTWPKPGIIDLDFGTEVLLQNPGFRRRHPEVDVDNILWETATSELDDKGIPKNSNGFFNVVKIANKFIADPEVETIVLDSLTAFSVLAAHAGLIVQSRGQNPRSHTLSEARKDGIIIYKKQDFGAEMGGVEQFLDQLVGCGKNVLVIAHQREVTTESGLVTHYEPLITGSKLRAKIARWFSDVWYLDSKDGGDRELIFVPTKKLKVVGSRMGLEKPILNPTYSKVIHELLG